MVRGRKGGQLSPMRGDCHCHRHHQDVRHTAIAGAWHIASTRATAPPPPAVCDVITPTMRATTVVTNAWQIPPQLPSSQQRPPLPHLRWGVLGLRQRFPERRQVAARPAGTPRTGCDGVGHGRALRSFVAALACHRWGGSIAAAAAGGCLRVQGNRRRRSWGSIFEEHGQKALQGAPGMA